METKFTKGEWVFIETVRSSIKGTQKIGIFPKNDCSFVSHAICSIQCNDKYARENYEANARLIASAPEMFEALVGLLRTIPLGFSNEYTVLAKNAIEKATE